jgi:hypothetical protein
MFDVIFNGQDFDHTKKEMKLLLIYYLIISYVIRILSRFLLHYSSNKNYLRHFNGAIVAVLGVL